MKKITVAEKRLKAQKELHDMALTRGGAQKIAQFFIETVSWNKLIEAHNELAR